MTQGKMLSIFLAFSLFFSSRGQALLWHGLGALITSFISDDTTLDSSNEIAFHQILKA